MAVADFSLPLWLNQDNTQLFPQALVAGARVGSLMADAQRAKQAMALSQAQEQRIREEQARKAQQEAIRFQGFQDYNRDVQAGTPPLEALSKNAGKMYFQTPTLATAIDQQAAIQARSDAARAMLEQRASHDTAIEAIRQQNADTLKTAREGRIESDRENRDLRERLATTVEEGKNTRATERAEHELALKRLEQQGKAALYGDRLRNLAPRLSDADKAAMNAELMTVRALPSEDQGSAIERIHEKYSALQRGEKPPVPKSDEEAKIDAEITRLKIDRAKNPNARFFPWNPTRTQQIKALEAQKKSAVAPPETQQAPAAAPATAQPITPTTQAEFDALPSGALFINPKDGKTYRKK